MIRLRTLHMTLQGTIEPATLQALLASLRPTLALNSGLNTRRLRHPGDLLMMDSCPDTFAKANNPNNAIIRPVQFCRATSALCDPLGFLCVSYSIFNSRKSKYLNQPSSGRSDSFASTLMIALKCKFAVN
jgi:hypothetical protein